MEYISREEILAEYDRQHKGPAGGARKIMETWPAADVALVRRGKWEDGYSVAFCSVCGEQSEWRTPYCPMCGAKME